MTPAHGAVVVYRLGLWRVLLVCVLVVILAYRYFVAPVLDGVDRFTPWDGIVPGSCQAAPEPRPAGFEGMANDAGRLVRSIADGPPSPERMVGWFHTAGQGARTTWVAFDGGVDGRQLLPNAPTPQSRTLQVTDGKLTEPQVAALALEVGWPATEVPNVVARVRAESNNDPTERDYVDGTHHGLLQLGAAERRQYGVTDGFDPRQNLTGALKLWQARGWQPWRASDSAIVVRPVDVQPAACAVPDVGVMQAGHGETDLDPVTLPARRAVLATFGDMTVGGWGTRGNATEHDELDGHGRKASRALDFMVEGAKGDQVAQYLIDHAAPLRVEYLIWNRRLWSPQRGWRAYNGASPHTDHVHLTVLKADERVRLAG